VSCSFFLLLLFSREILVEIWSLKDGTSLLAEALVYWKASRHLP